MHRKEGGEVSDEPAYVPRLSAAERRAWRRGRKFAEERAVERLRAVASDYGDDGYGINVAADILEEEA